MKGASKFAVFLLFIYLFIFILFYLQVPVCDVNLTVLTQALSAPVIAVASPSAVRYGHSLINIWCFALLWSVHFCASALIYFVDRFSLFSEHRFPVHLDIV